MSDELCVVIGGEVVTVSVPLAPDAVVELKAKLGGSYSEIVGVPAFWWREGDQVMLWPKPAEGVTTEWRDGGMYAACPSNPT